MSKSTKLTSLQDCAEAARKLVLEAWTGEGNRLEAEGQTESFASHVFGLAQKLNPCTAETWGQVQDTVVTFIRSDAGAEFLSAHDVILETTEKGERKLPRLFIQYWSNVKGGLKLGLNHATFENEQDYRTATKAAREAAQALEAREGKTADEIAAIDKLDAMATQAANDLQTIRTALRNSDGDSYVLLVEAVHEAAKIAEEINARIEEAKKLAAAQKEAEKIERMQAEHDATMTQKAA